MHPLHSRREFIQKDGTPQLGKAICHDVLLMANSHSFFVVFVYFRFSCVSYIA